MSSAFNPTDPKYQVSPDFPPDKESSWKHSKEKDGWCVVHKVRFATNKGESFLDFFHTFFSHSSTITHFYKALKDEIAMFADAFKMLSENRESFKRGGLKDWESVSIQTAFAAHFEHVHWHHTDEDDTVVPYWKKRFKYPERLETAHPELEAHIDKIKSIIENLKAGDKIDQLQKEWKTYSEMIGPHMDEEEKIALPLYRAYFTSEDMKPVIKEIIKHAPKIEMGSAAHSMGPEKFRNEFMVQEGIPFFVWYIDFKYRLAEFEERFVKHIDALKSGQEPLAKPNGWCTTS